jgi:magnesium-transporting ATPase (P-type)
LLAEEGSESEDSDFKDADKMKIESANGKDSYTLESEKQKVQEMLKLLALCHDCEAEEAVIDGEMTLFYQGASPDEITLVDFAKTQGFEFIKSTETSSTINYYKESGMTQGETKLTKTYKIHRKIDFSR